jgi:hypothetical protein
VYEFRSEDTPLTEAQICLRSRVLEHIENYPESFDMADWENTVAASCKTTRCIAGWAEFLSRGSVMADVMAQEHDKAGIELLGLTISEYRESGKFLFYTTNEEALERMRDLVYGQSRRSDMPIHEGVPAQDAAIDSGE